MLRSLISSGSGRGVRSIAEEVGLSPGYVSKVVQELERRGYAARRKEGIALRHGEELLKDWLVAYRKRSSETWNYFVPATSAEAVMIAMKESSQLDDGMYALSLQAGASLIVRHAEFDSVDAYVREEAMAESMARDLGARQVERGANLRLSLPHYRVSAFYGVRDSAGLPVVSDLQLYLDLYDYPLRGREQAEKLFESRLRARLEAAEAI